MIRGRKRKRSTSRRANRRRLERKLIEGGMSDIKAKARAKKIMWEDKK